MKHAGELAMKEVSLVLQPSDANVSDLTAPFNIMANFTNYRVVLTADTLTINWTVRVIWPNPEVVDTQLLLSIVPHDSKLFTPAHKLSPTISPGELRWTYTAKVSNSIEPNVDYAYSIIIGQELPHRVHHHKIDPLLVLSG